MSWSEREIDRAQKVHEVKRAVIAILDDEQERLRAMLPLLARDYPGCEVATFENAPDMIAWLVVNLHRARLLSLDHDLGPTQRRGDESFDPGTGRDVADFLAGRPAVCPIILHTTNHLAAPGMVDVLETSGWEVTHVVPYGDLAWVKERWIEEVRRVLPK